MEMLLMKFYTPLKLIDLLMETKMGTGVIQYVATTPKEMLQKLALLTGELSAENSAVIP